MAETLSSVCAVCKLVIPKSKPKYHLQCKLSRGGGPTELYHQLRGVAGAELSASLGSHFLCLSCRGKLLTVANQKKRYKESRSELLRKLHDDSAPSLIRISPQTLTSWSQKQPLLSPAKTGFSPFAKRQATGSGSTEEPSATPVFHHELFPGASRIPVPSTISRAAQRSIGSLEIASIHTVKSTAITAHAATKPFVFN